jgi:hypothetical protein
MVLCLATMVRVSELGEHVLAGGSTGLHTIFNRTTIKQLYEQKKRLSS